MNFDWTPEQEALRKEVRQFFPSPFPRFCPKRDCPHVTPSEAKGLGGFSCIVVGMTFPSYTPGSLGLEYMGMGFAVGFALGLASGLVSNWWFNVLIRAVAPKFSRYSISVQDIGEEMSQPLGGSLDMVEHVAFVRITPPRWRGVLVEPIKEYLIVVLRLDDGNPVRGKWVEGDVKTLRLLADGADLAQALLYTSVGSGIYLSDHYPSSQMTGDLNHTIHLEIRRSVDGSVAASANIVIPSSLYKPHIT